MKKHIQICLLTSTLLTMTAFAQPDEGPCSENLISKLNLDETRAAELEAILDSGHAERKAIRDASRLEMDALHAKEMEKAAAFLTSDELIQLEDMMERHKERHAHGPKGEREKARKKENQETIEG